MNNNNNNEGDVSPLCTALCAMHGLSVEEFRDFCQQNGITTECGVSLSRFCQAKSVPVEKGLLFVQPTKDGPDAENFQTLFTIPYNGPFPTLTEDGKSINHNGAQPGLVEMLKTHAIVAKRLGVTTTKAMYSPTKGVYAWVLGPLDDNQIAIARGILNGICDQKYFTTVTLPRSCFE